MRMPRLFVGSEKPIARISDLLSLIGPGGAVWAILSYASAYFAPLAKYGWGAFVLFGFGATCMGLFAASAAMMAWRYLHPLAVTTTPAPAGGRQPFGQQAAPPIVFTVAAQIVGAELLRGVMRSAPQVPEKTNPQELTNEQLLSSRRLLEPFIRQSITILSETDYVSELTVIMTKAESRAAQTLNLYRISRIPPEIDSLEFREYLISREKSSALIKFGEEKLFDYSREMQNSLRTLRQLVFLNRQ